MRVYSGNKTKQFILKTVITTIFLTFVFSGYTLYVTSLSTIHGYGMEYEADEPLLLNELLNKPQNELLNELHSPVGIQVNYKLYPYITNRCITGKHVDIITNNSTNSNNTDTGMNFYKDSSIIYNVNIDDNTDILAINTENIVNHEIEDKEKDKNNKFQIHEAVNNEILKENNDKLLEGNGNCPQLQEENNNEEIKLPSKPVFSGNKNKKQIALTFDDGPDEHFTLKILDILKENNVSATFFVLGNSVKKYPNVLNHIRDEGHDIGNHSLSHKNFKKLSEDQIKCEITETEKIIKSVNEGCLPLFRPPFGASNKKVEETIHSLGYYDIRWSVDTEDWSGIKPSEIMTRIEKQLYPGGIILMHCSGRRQPIENSIKALPEIIRYVKEKGYEFVTISQLLEI